DETQRKKLMGTYVEMAGATAVMDPAVGKELGLTDEQKTKLRDAMGPPPGGRDASGGGAGGFRERREKMEKDIRATLTSDQQKKLESLKSDKLDVDVSALRGQGRGGRGRDRSSDKAAEKKSAA